MNSNGILESLRRSGVVTQTAANGGSNVGNLIADSYLDQIGGADCMFDSFTSGGAFSSTFASSGGSTSC